MLQLNPPIQRVVLADEDWTGPTGVGVANFIIEGHRDDDILWGIDFDHNGQTWFVPNRYTRAVRNQSYGRNLKPAATPPVVDSIGFKSEEVFHSIQKRKPATVPVCQPSEDSGGV